MSAGSYQWMNCYASEWKKDSVGNQMIHLKYHVEGIFKLINSGNECKRINLLIMN